MDYHQEHSCHSVQELEPNQERTLSRQVFRIMAYPYLREPQLSPVRLYEVQLLEVPADNGHWV